MNQPNLTIRLEVADNVVMARVGLPTGTEILGEEVSCRTHIPTGHKIATARIEAGEPVAIVLHEATGGLVEAGFDKVDYLELRAENGLRVLKSLDEPARLLAAAFLGETRLIDNVAVRPGPGD